MLIVSLALSDLLMINAVAPPLFINIFLSKWWAYGVLACEIYGFLGGVFGGWYKKLEFTNPPLSKIISAILRLFITNIHVV